MSHILISGTFKMSKLSWIAWVGLQITWALEDWEISSWNQKDAAEEKAGEVSQKWRWEKWEAWWRTPPPLLALTEEEGRHSLGMRVAFGSWEPPTPARKGIPWPHSSMELNSGTNPNEPTMKQIVPQCPQEGTQTCWHLDFSPGDQRQSSDLRNKFVLL